jgi:pimeloyl-ACP methyl ester carboxylesterase
MRLVDEGSGPVLVLVPGIQGRWEYLRPAMAALAPRFRVLTFSLADEPSAGSAVGQARGFADYVEQVRTALDTAGVERAIVCGISFGGLVAARFAADFPERTASLVLVSTPAPGWRLRPRHQFYARLPYLFGPVFAAEAPWRLARELAASFPSRSARWRFAVSLMVMLAHAPVSAARIARRARMIGEASAVVECARLSVPTLVVTGETSLDYVVPAAGSATYAHLIPGAEAAVLAHTGHLGFLTRPAEFAALIRQFVDGRSPKIERTPSVMHAL